MGTVRQTMAEGHSAAYWEAQYSKSTDEFDWYQQPAHMDNILAQIPSGTSVLCTGCGTSAVPAHLAGAGVDVHAIDWSNTAIGAMKNKHANVNWMSGDVTAMPNYQDGQFDFVLDKGCFDSLLCQEAGTLKSQQYIAECNRVLKGSGKLLIITTGDKDTRLSYFSDMNADPNPKKLAKPSVNPEATSGGGAHFCYSLAKK